MRSKIESMKKVAQIMLRADGYASLSRELTPRENGPEERFFRSGRMGWLRVTDRRRHQLGPRYLIQGAHCAQCPGRIREYCAVLDSSGWLTVEPRPWHTFSPKNRARHSTVGPCP